MKLEEALKWNALVLNVFPTRHPPSLPNPQRVPLDDDPQRGWRRSDSQRDKQRARIALADVMQRTRNQMQPEARVQRQGVSPRPAGST